MLITVILNARFCEPDVFTLKSKDLDLVSLGKSANDLETIAEWIFDRSNNPAYEGEPRLWIGRSFSVGDAVMVDGDLAICLASGWKTVLRPRVPLPIITIEI